jgi:hypothetical protein
LIAWSLECPVCEAPIHVIGAEPDGRPLYRCLDHSAASPDDHIDIYSRMENPPPHHFEYFSIRRGGGRPVRQLDRPVPGGTMDPEQRLWVIEIACREFLRRPDDTDYLVIKSGTDWCHTVQFLYCDGDIEVQVNPRHWGGCEGCRNRPLPPEAIGALRAMGFVDGEPGTNFRLDALKPDPVRLSRLAEQLFLAVYGERADFAAGVRFRHGDVAEHFFDSVTKPWFVGLSIARSGA